LHSGGDHRSGQAFGGGAEILGGVVFFGHLAVAADHQGLGGLRLVAIQPQANADAPKKEGQRYQEKTTHPQAHGLSPQPG
jgi:hypothetical protein